MGAGINPGSSRDMSTPPNQELITNRLESDRADQLEKIEKARITIKSNAMFLGAKDGPAIYVTTNEEIEREFEDFIDQSAKFIHHVAGEEFRDYEDELRKTAGQLKLDILRTLDENNYMTRAFPGNSTRVRMRDEHALALDKIIKRKLQDFSLGVIGGVKVNSSQNNVTHNTVNIINSNISETILTITQSGKDAHVKDAAQKIEEMLKSEEITKLPEDMKIEVLDHAEIVVTELNKQSPDNAKVLRSLKRFGSFLKSAGTDVAAKLIAEITVAWAKAHGF